MTSLLLVHNQSDDRAMYAEYLRGEGFDVREVSTTDEGLALVGQVDAVITGLLVAGTLHPLDFITRIRSERSTPILVLTACADAESIEKAYSAGAHTVLVKPCLPDTLLHAAQRVIGSRPVHLVPPTPRRVVDDRRSGQRGGRRDGDRLPTES